jgi:hypothetical protein
MHGSCVAAVVRFAFLSKCVYSAELLAHASLTVKRRLHKTNQGKGFDLLVWLLLVEYPDGPITLLWKCNVSSLPWTHTCAECISSCGVAESRKDLLQLQRPSGISGLTGSLHVGAKVRDKSRQGLFIGIDGPQGYVYGISTCV